MLEAIGLIGIGLAALVLGGELLVRSASRLAAVAGISPLVIGLTVVAFGTSAPELAVSVKACLAGETDIAVGNVVGSNIFNVLFILGVSALIAPLVVSSQLVRIDVPLMIVASVAALLLGLDGAIGRIDGLFLFAGVVCYTIWTVRQSRKESAATKEEFGAEFAGDAQLTGRRLLLQILIILAGLVILSFGAQWVVAGTVSIGRLFGMSELLIGLTIVAAGTSLPEAATSVMASIRGERDIAVGNVVGSNIFNLTCVLGLSAAIVPGGVAVSESVLRLDMLAMVAVAIACLPVFFTGHVIARWEGGVFVGYYLAYTGYLVLSAVIPAMSRSFGLVILGFVVPLTVLTLLLGVIRSWRESRRQRLS